MAKPTLFESWSCFKSTSNISILLVLEMFNFAAVLVRWTLKQHKWGVKSYPNLILNFTLGGVFCINYPKK